MRVAVTGAGGRLGRALVDGPRGAPFTGPAGPLAWTRATFDLDAPDGVGARCSTATGRRSSSTPRPGPTSTAAPATRSCALAPQRRRRPASSPTACAARGIDLVVVSTNEVFDGRRTDGRGYAPDDPPTPGNPYGASKLPGERAAAAAYAGATAGARARDRPDGLAVRPAGPRLPGQDPRRRRAGRAPPASRSALVADEWGTPTYTADVADAIVELLGGGRAIAGIHHLVNGLARHAGRLGARTSSAGRASTVRGRGRPGGDLGAAVDAAALGRPRADAAAVAASRCGRGPTRWPTTPPRAPRAARRPASRGTTMTDLERPPSRCPASATARSPATPTRAARSASCGGPTRSAPRPGETGAPGDRAAFVQANLSTSAPGVLRGLHYHRRQLDYWVVAAGRAFVALVDVRPRRSAGRATAGRRDARARAPTSGSSSRPASPTASSPSSRSSCSTS